MEFICFHGTALNEKQMEDLFKRRTYACLDDKTIQYPLIVARPLDRRRNFLVPYDISESKASEPKSVLLLPQHSSIAIAAPEEVKSSMLFPSVVRALSLSYITESFCKRMFSSSSLLACLPINSIKPALVTPMASEVFDYQRLETLGDTVLKFTVCLQLIADHPLWHEGYLTKRKDQIINNAILAKAAITMELYRWIVRDRFSPRRWQPHYIQKSSESNTDKDEADNSGATQPTLSIKILADVIEALIGAVYLEGGLDYSIECIRIFNLSGSWESVSTRICQIADRAEHFEKVPSQLTQVERMLGYNFSQKAFLVEALMHASYHSKISTVSYERMEFLGDSILDMIVVEILFHAPGKKYPPGQMHIRKSALTNRHFLGYICLRCSTEVVTKMPEPNGRNRISIKEHAQTLHLWQCLLHSSITIIDDLRNTSYRYEKYKEEIENGLFTDALYPWAALTKLQAPKLCSDMIESVVAAVYLDSGGNMTVVRDILERLGILPVLRRVIDENVDVRHPLSRVSHWASKYYKTVDYKFTHQDGNITCILTIDEEVITSSTERYTGKSSEESIKFRVAEEGIAILSARMEEA